ncbi:uncharacterized protein B0I36DRAFT_360730 [Microdochium trichocladiopsis]|uniref:Chitin-binding type-1 domain-containing protein n=1 Tax=Microdochium trichocladiopsis TaxID=1682393 RepID=A0A9P8YCF2_9PEZI|nr:uncharacterized protein B0I36DRAFT_360730 [Microdochium trichocladiopsis]KAH7035345.1 hypothetical protein B0I36DRAFT_360730 [Microdochium trichocladiopsis]
MAGQGRVWLMPLILYAFFVHLACVVRADECEPAWWLPDEFEIHDMPIFTSASSAPTNASTLLASSTSESAIPTPVGPNPLITTGNLNAGEISCRYTANTYDTELDCCTCAKLAKRYGISVDLFFQLNPGVNKECNNLRHNTEYCVRGFIEPGTSFPCCNSNTFTCGDSVEEDCAPGICYEGLCYGDKIWSTTGDCGKQHGYKKCAGKWGDCCNAQGRCGTGPDFCGIGNCQLGDCNLSVSVPATQLSMRPFTESSTDLSSSTSGNPETTTARPSMTTTTKPPST